MALVASVAVVLGLLTAGIAVAQNVGGPDELSGYTNDVRNDELRYQFDSDGHVSKACADGRIHSNNVDSTTWQWRDNIRLCAIGVAFEALDNTAAIIAARDAATAEAAALRAEVATLRVRLEVEEQEAIGVNTLQDVRIAELERLLTQRAWIEGCDGGNAYVVQCQISDEQVAQDAAAARSVAIQIDRVNDRIDGLHG